MIEKVEKKIISALSRIAETRKVEDSKISIAIKFDIENEDVNYFLVENGEFVKKENSNENLKLNFTKDILNKKMDLLGQGFMIGMFLQTYFNRSARNLKIDKENLLILVKKKDENLIGGLYNSFKLLKRITLNEIMLSMNEK